MTDQQIVLPPGYELVEVDGKQVVQKQADSLLSKTIAFRTTTSEHNELLPFRETFATRSWSDAFRWLLIQPEVVAVMDARVQAAMVTP